MRDPFDTGPVLRLGDTPAKAREPNTLREGDEIAGPSPLPDALRRDGDRLQVDTSKLTMVTIPALADWSSSSGGPIAHADQLPDDDEECLFFEEVDPSTPDQPSETPNLFGWTVDPDPRLMTQDKRDQRWSHPLIASCRSVEPEVLSEEEFKRRHPYSSIVHRPGPETPLEFHQRLARNHAALVKKDPKP